MNGVQNLKRYKALLTVTVTVGRFEEENEEGPPLQGVWSRDIVTRRENIGDF